MSPPRAFYNTYLRAQQRQHQHKSDHGRTEYCAVAAAFEHMFLVRSWYTQVVVLVLQQSPFGLSMVQCARRLTSQTNANSLCMRAMPEQVRRSVFVGAHGEWDWRTAEMEVELYVRMGVNRCVPIRSGAVRGRTSSWWSRVRRRRMAPPHGAGWRAHSVRTSHGAPRPTRASLGILGGGYTHSQMVAATKYMCGCNSTRQHPPPNAIRCGR